MVAAGSLVAAIHCIDSLIALGGGSSLDCAKGINFVLTNGGDMRDYCGFGKAARPMLPMIAVPTTAGTGSEAQSYALISDSVTHVKMACGDPKAAFRAAILDPLLTRSQPRRRDRRRRIRRHLPRRRELRHYQTHRRLRRLRPRSLAAARERASSASSAIPAISKRAAPCCSAAHYAGIAIENSMLGATHACANPLTARYGTTHGVAIAALLTHVVRWNQPAAGALYAELAPDLADRLAALAATAGLSVRLRDLGVPHEALPVLAEDAAVQWTGRFNPRPFDEAAALEIYESAY